MVQYFLEIFSTPSDKARLVTTLIAALIAVTVVFVTQWFNSKRSRKEKYIEKIEETFTSVISVQELMGKLHGEIVTNFHKYQTLGEETTTRFLLNSREGYDQAHPIHLGILRSGDKLMMLSQLYFPVLKTTVEQLLEKHQAIYSGFTDAEDLGDYLSFYNEHRPLIQEGFQKIMKDLTIEMNKTMH